MQAWRQARKAFWRKQHFCWSGAGRASRQKEQQVQRQRGEQTRHLPADRRLQASLTPQVRQAGRSRQLGSLGACAWTPEVPRASWVSLGKVLHCLVSKLFVCKVEIALRSSRGGCWRMKSQHVQSAGQGLARGDAMSDNSGPLPTRRAARGRCARGDMCLILKAEGER